MDSLLLWLVIGPLLGALFCLPFAEKISKYITLGCTLVGFVLSIFLYFVFSPENSGMQFQWSSVWIASFQIRFALGVDGLSLLLVLLTKLMVPIAVLAHWRETRHLKGLMMNLLLLDTAMTGTFLATDIFLFYVFWELVLIPMVFIIGIWGSAERIYAALKFFLYTFAGSVLMLVAIFWIFSAFASQHGYYSADISSFYGLSWSKDVRFLGLTAQELVFLAFTIAFAIKVPLFPFHTWLPDAHVQAPTGGSILLAAVLLKMGTYGLLRFSVPICPEAFHSFSSMLSYLSIGGILYGAWVAFQQTDFKKLVAYSSVSHMGFVVLGICAMNTESLRGAVLQMVNHGLSTGALFFLVGALYERRHSRKFADFGGLAKAVPRYAFFLTFVSCASMAVPGLNGFVGEFLILLGTFASDPWLAGIAATGVIFGAAYTLIMLRQVLFGPITSEENKLLPDLRRHEMIALVPLCLVMIWIGIYPQPFLKYGVPFPAKKDSPTALAHQPFWIEEWGKVSQGWSKVSHCEERSRSRHCEERSDEAISPWSSP
ncbi:MAG: NADH-quinone oxidoreductase subunit M [Deltaproteobacteria bacterium]|nr:NADH-quinone oxidoreductase subunit M [Deltaproteobacteria bacterium]